MSISNSLATAAPHLLSSWSPLNGRLEPRHVRRAANRRVWWECQDVEAHPPWQTSVGNRTVGETGCNICTGNGFGPEGSFEALHPELTLLWHPVRNGDQSPGDYAPRSSVYAWWKCGVSPDHEWRAQIGSLVSGSECPFCAVRGARASLSNSLARHHPDVAASWLGPLEGDASPWTVTVSSAVWVEWGCASGHRFDDRVYTRVRSAGCPVCLNRRVAPENSLAALMPELAGQWHPDLNGPLRPTDVSIASGRTVWWTCEVAEDHVWPAKVANRVRGNSCGMCTNRRVSSTNSLRALFPRIADELHPLQDDGVADGSRVLAGSNDRKRWRCSFNPEHVWSTTVTARTLNGTGCPDCAPVSRSMQEVALLFELMVHFDIDPQDTSVRTSSGLERVDIKLQEHKLIVEFDGSYWHRDREERDREKVERLRQAGWGVVRVREAPLKAITESDVVVPFKAPADEVAVAVVEQVELISGTSVPTRGLHEDGAGPLRREAAETFYEALRRSELEGPK